MFSLGKIANIACLTFFLVDQLLGYTLDRVQPVSKIITEYTVIIITLGITNVSMLCCKPDKSEYFCCGLLFMVLVCFITYNPIRLARLGLFTIENSPVNASWVQKCSADF